MDVGGSGFDCLRPSSTAFDWEEKSFLMLEPIRVGGDLRQPRD
jgi:hypothetical protein